MIKKIKNHVNNLTVTQKTLYLVLIWFIVVGDLTLDVFFSMGSYIRDQFRFGIVLVCIVGIFLFRKKEEE